MGNTASGHGGLNIYVTNNTYYNFDFQQSNYDHGSIITAAQTSIIGCDSDGNPQTNDQLIFSANYSSIYGPLGIICYNGGGVNLYLYFNNPIAKESATNMAKQYQWFYPMLQLDGTGTASYIPFYCEVQNFTMSPPGNYMSGDIMNPSVIIYEI